MVSVQALTAGVRTLVQTGEQTQRLTSAFSAVSGSVESARKEMAFASDVANRLGLSTTDLSKSYLGLVAASNGTRLAGQATKDIF